MGWQVVCPDGAIRHYPYVNKEDAELDAKLMDERGCNLYDMTGSLEKIGLPECEGTGHHVEWCEDKGTTVGVS